jgi:hypothetical protein
MGDASPQGAVALDMPQITNTIAANGLGPQAPHAATDTMEDEGVMLALFAAAAKEPPECERSAHILGFESSVVEDCYDATHGPTRLLGCQVACGLMMIQLGVHIAVKATGSSLTANLGVWLATTCAFVLVVTILPVTLCWIQGRMNANRHALWRTAHGTALFTFIAIFAGNLSILQNGVSTLDSSTLAGGGSAGPPWEATIRTGYIWGASSMILPMYMALLLRINFPWVAIATVAFSIPCAAITAEDSSPMMILLILMVLCIIIAMLYATEVSSRQRFVSQIRLQRQVDEQKETILKAAADKALAATKSFSQIVSATAHGDACPALL